MEPRVRVLLSQLEEMNKRANSFEELREMFFTAHPKLRATGMGATLGDALAVATAQGIFDASADDG